MNNKKSFKRLLKILLVQITLLIGLSSIITAFANPVVNITGSETAKPVPEPVEIEENTEAIEQEELKDVKDEIIPGEQPSDKEQETSQEEQVTQAETPEKTVQVQETTDTPEIAVQAATDASNFNFDASTGTITSLSQNCTLSDIVIPKQIDGVDVVSIGNGAFMGFTNITSISFEDGNKITKLGSSAFCDLPNLTSFEMPQKLTVIPMYCFKGCKNLTFVELGKSVVSIEYGAFYKSGILSIKLPDTLTTLGQMSFSSTPLTNISIPDGVVEIPFECFSGCDKLTSVKLGSKIETIGSSSFSYSGISSIELPTTLTTIGYGAFKKTKLINIIIPNNVTSIGDECFQNCESLENIVLGENIESIGKRAFYWCTSLTKIKLPKKLKKINEYLLSDCRNLKELEMPSELERIEDRAFESTKITEITIPDTVNYIGHYAFNNNSQLKKIYIPAKEVDSISYAPWGASSACVIWKSTILVKDAQGNDKYVYESSTKTITKYIGTLENDVIDIEKDFKNANIKEEVTVIGNYAFANAHNITTVKIPDTVKYIRDDAFSSCGKLSSIIIPDSVIELGDHSFYGCDSLKNVILGNGIKEIEYSAFASCRNLEEITIPGQPSTISNGVFSNCDKLKFIRLPDCYKDEIKNAPWSAQNAAVIWKETLLVPEKDPKYVYDYDEKSGEGTITKYIGTDEEANIEIDFKAVGTPVTKLGNYAFANCNSIKNVIVPDTVTEFENNVFLNSSSLESVTLSNNIKFLGNNCFESCVKLRSVKLPDKLQSIGNYSFMGCESLERVDLPDDITNIGKSSFENCYALQSVKLPKKLTLIDIEAFKKCYALQSIEFPNTLKEIRSSAFFRCTSLTKLDFPDSVTIFGDGHLAPNLVGPGVFQECSNLEEVKLSENLLNIPDNLFLSCKKLSTINIHDNIKYIGMNSLAYTALTGILTLPKSVKGVSSSAFYGVALDKLVIPYARTKCPYRSDHPYGLKEGNPTQIVYGGGVPNIKARVTPTKDSTGKKKYLLDFDIDFRDKDGNVYDAITRINLPDETGELSGNIIHVGQRESWSTADNNKTLDVTQRAVYKIQIAGLDNELHDYEILLGKIELENNEAEFYLGDMKTLTMNQILYRLGIIDKDGHTLIKDEFGKSVDCTYNISDEQMNAIHNMKYGDKLETKIGIHDPLLQKDYDITINVVSNAIRGKVVWDDNGDSKGLRPDSLDVNLYSKKVNSSDAEKLVTTKAVTEGTDGNWSFDFEEASPWENKNVGGVVGTFHCGDELKYTISPTKPAYYSMEIKENQSNFFTITLTVDKIPVTGLVEGSNGKVLIGLSIGLLILSSTYFIIKKQRKLIKK